MLDYAHLRADVHLLCSNMQPHLSIFASKNTVYLEALSLAWYDYCGFRESWNSNHCACTLSSVCVSSRLG